jgi:hypothetical protein
MPIDPKKLAAYANGGKKGGAPEEPAEEEMVDDGDGDAPEVEENESGAGLDELVKVMSEFAEDAEAACDELDASVLEDPDAELEEPEAQILEEGLANLPPKLKAALENYAADISMEDAQSVADRLFEADAVQDPDRLAGWLYRVGQVV